MFSILFSPDATGCENLCPISISYMSAPGFKTRLMKLQSTSFFLHIEQLYISYISQFSKIIQDLTIWRTSYYCTVLTHPVYVSKLTILTILHIYAHKLNLTLPQSASFTGIESFLSRKRQYIQFSSISKSGNILCQEIFPKMHCVTTS